MPQDTITKTSRGPRLVAMAAGGAALALALLPSPSFALDTQAAWQGIATTTGSTSAQCAGVGGAAVSDAEVSVFRPKILSTDSNTYLAFVFLRAAITLENLSESSARQMHGTGKDEILGIDGRGRFIEGPGTYSLTITPASVTTSTPVITITGKITNFFDVPGCDITFQGVYAKRID